VLHILAAPRSDLEIEIVQDTQALIPLSTVMIDTAIEVLGKGPADMTAEEWELFKDIFDPGNTGTIDQAYINDVIHNYDRIRQHLEEGLEISYAPDNASCRGMRLYYTNFHKIYVCPYFLDEDSQERKARTLIHEVTHIELLVLDRSYYDPKSFSSRYQALTPRGPIYTEIPLIGHILREIKRSDTLYHPDAYAWFAGLSWMKVSTNVQPSR
jgi:hypothetical protein